MQDTVVTAADDHAVFELRRYRLKPGAREDLIILFESEFIETQEAVGMQVIAQFRDLDHPDQFVWLRGFPAMERRAGALKAFYTGPAWAAHGPAANETMVNSDNVLMLREAWPGSGFKPDTDAPGDDGLIACSISYLAPGTAPDFAAFYRERAVPVLEAAGLRLSAALISETRRNDFPRLPVREGETVFVAFARLADEAAHGAVLDRLAQSPAWRGEIGPEIARRTWREDETFRLVPTARSAWRG